MNDRTAVAAAQPRNDLEREIRHVVERLHSRFPGLSEADIARAVTSEYRRRGSVRVRDYLPVLVERQVRNQLKDLAARRDLG